MDIPPRVYRRFKSCFCHQRLFLNGFLHDRLILVGIFRARNLPEHCPGLGGFGFCKQCCVNAQGWDHVPGVFESQSLVGLLVNFFFKGSEHSSSLQ